ncbi:divalent cation transporter [Alteromonas sp. KUL42]|uniref:ZIP family metal transporter n=1 Tax=Alteromonas sp. KUL42 TaxID=2480797 RepID=UPI0010364C5B|nr:divalent cation transporter [Alteromonas sp. KUL42]TAP32217.1 divalent cation transporter [Alteromonas sp. KUL42]GEA08834.1 divalent cation transporter [Alteromonas sp. KUL42]
MGQADIVLLVVISTLAGLAMPAGALLATYKGIQPRWIEKELRHGILALGAGALISAVGLVLVPEGVKDVSIPTALLCFVGGALAFMALDIYLAKKKTAGSQLTAMLTDFVPESIALGATAALGGGTMLLGALIAVQNLPEGFNAFREMLPKNKKRSGKLIGLFAVMALLGPLCSLIGFYYLVHYPVIVSGIMLFAAGGILYSVFQDIAPQIRMENHWLPPLGGILGFLVGLIGYMLEKH